MGSKDLKVALESIWSLHSLLTKYQKYNVWLSKDGFVMNYISNEVGNVSYVSQIGSIEAGYLI